jgi:streptogramin lyase
VLFTDLSTNTIGEINPATGTVTPISSSLRDPLIGIASANDGAVWATTAGSEVGRYDYTASLSLTHSGQALGRDLTRDPDPARQAMWLLDPLGGRIQQVRRDCVVLATYAIPTFASDPQSITTGPDGNLWFTEKAGNKIGRVAPGGSVREFTIPTANSAPTGITVGSDGAVWFTESAPTASKIGRITAGGSIREFTPPTAGSEPHDIAAAPDGSLWFTQRAAGTVGRLDPRTGDIREFKAGTQPFRITAGPDGHMWFTRKDAVVRITTS